MIQDWPCRGVSVSDLSDGRMELPPPGGASAPLHQKESVEVVHLMGRDHSLEGLYIPSGQRSWRVPWGGGGPGFSPLRLDLDKQSKMEEAQVDFKIQGKEKVSVDVK